ncbi:uncharacterized protein LOC134257729 [Saccostrea cucullata]|uniref:uncharacterized protein LOC134257729 n=1 Tax=Saccostrea cuccullata TaxID=36930 RepID=UPI002ED3C1E6
MASEICLKDILDDFSVAFLNYTPTLRQKQRAIAFVKDSYIKSAKNFSGETGNGVQITAKVFLSQRKSEEPHRVDLEVNLQQKNFNDAHCSCKAGISGQCAHVLAVVNALEQWKISGYKKVPSEISSTSLPQQWDKPRGDKIKDEAVFTMIISCPTNLDRKRKPVIASYIDTRNIDINLDDIQELKKLKQSPISYLAGETTTKWTVNTPLGEQLIGSALSYHAPLIQPITKPRTAWSCGDTVFPKALPSDLQNIQQLAHEWKELNLTLSEATEVEKSTRSQSFDQRWHIERKKRITASNFRLIMKKEKGYK